MDFVLSAGPLSTENWHTLTKQSKLVFFCIGDLILKERRTSSYPSIQKITVSMEKLWSQTLVAAVTESMKLLHSKVLFETNMSGGFLSTVNRQAVGGRNWNHTCLLHAPRA